MRRGWTVSSGYEGRVVSEDGEGDEWHTDLDVVGSAEGQPDFDVQLVPTGEVTCFECWWNGVRERDTTPKGIVYL
jgi:hypothetical protein